MPYCPHLSPGKLCYCSFSYYLESFPYSSFYWLTLSFLHLHSRNWLYSPQSISSSSLHFFPLLFLPHFYLYFLLSPQNPFYSFWTSLLSVHLPDKYCLGITFTYAINLWVKVKWIYYFSFYRWISLIQRDFYFFQFK